MRPLPATWHRRGREHGSHQAALLQQLAREPDRYRAARPAFDSTASHERARFGGKRAEDSLAAIIVNRPIDFGSGGEIGHQLYNELGASKLDSVYFQGVPTDEAKRASYFLWRLDAALATLE
jgi:hypothetical protein